MPGAESCRQCGAYLLPDAPSRGNCGALTKSPTVPIGVGLSFVLVVAGIGVGILGAIVYMLVVYMLAAALPCGSIIADALAVLGFVAAAVAFVFGIRLARRGDWKYALLLIPAGVAFLLPATPCTIGLFQRSSTFVWLSGTARCGPSPDTYVPPERSSPHAK